MAELQSDEPISHGRPDGWWYPWIFVGAFMVVLSVNLVMLYFSTTTFNGLETRHSYEEGNSYNALIADEEAQKKLGWVVDLDISGGGVEGMAKDAPRPARLLLTVFDKDHHPVEGMNIRVAIRRPTIEGYDQNITLDPVTPGRYAKTVELPMAGQWEVRLEARSDQNVYRTRRRVVVD